MTALRILVLHSRYLSGPLSGENRVVADEAELLRSAGHDVEVLAPSPDASSRRELAGRMLAGGGAREVRETIEARGFDVVHAHNLFPALGPGVLTAAADAGAAVVLTLHNYRLMCLAGTFRRDGHACEVCLGRAPWRGVVHRCYRGSTTQSAVLAASLVEHRRARRVRVRAPVPRGQRLRARQARRGGFPAGRIVVKANAVPESARRVGPGEYFLVLGRLSPEKGVAGLVRAWRPELGELRVVGDGPERGEIAALAEGRGVVVREPVAPEEVPGVLAGARALLLPSLSYEGQPRVVLEAYAAGVPVIAHRVGAIGELVPDGVTGVLVPPEDATAWHERGATAARRRVLVGAGRGRASPLGRALQPRARAGGARGRLPRRAGGSGVGLRAMGRGPLIVCYHAVSDTWPSPLAIRPKELREQLGFFLSRGYVGLTATDAERRRREGSLPKKALVVTFDDGYASTALAQPILAEAGFPATVFVPTAFADSGDRLRWPGLDEWDETPHAAELQPLVWEELARLAEAGWEIGSHGLSHRVLTRLDDAALATELRESRSAVEKHLGSCTSLAYPFGLADGRVSAAVRAAGYETALTLTRLHDVDEPFRRPRIELTGRETGRRLAVTLSAPFLWLRGSLPARVIQSRRGEPGWLPADA